MGVGDDRNNSEREGGEGVMGGGGGAGGRDRSIKLLISDAILPSQ